MSSQLEFIMQLYMMNMLQQQQQQQQQQPQNNFLQNLSPTKQKDNNIINTTTQLPNTTFTPIQQTKSQHQQQLLQQQQTQQQQSQQREQQQREQRERDREQQQQQDKRTQKRQNSQNTNCSSSRSSSPNSNSSFIQTNNLNLVQQQTQTQLLQQSMLLPNNLPTLTQLMLQQQQQQQQQAHLLTTPSNLLLTPTTPNSQNDAAQASKTQSLLADYILGSNMGQCSSFPFAFPSTFQHHTTPNVANISFTAQNFLQSSTVTSTPTEEKSSIQLVDVDEALAQPISTISDDDDDNDHNNDNDDDKVTLECNSNGVNDIKDITDEDDLPLSCLQTSSSGIVSSCTTSAESSGKLLLSSDLQGLESSTTMDETTNTMDSLQQMPYTPIKQEADSSLCCTSTTQQVLSLNSVVPQHNANSTLSEDSNMTPLALAASAILTPPSSEQLITNPYDSSQSSTPLATATGATTLSLTTASSLDAFLQNEENLKNLKKYSSYLECENPLCRQENLREHFHCFDGPCQGKILSKKDDIIRHLKWHKKRKESLQLGFARFSSSDDCAPAYGAGCAYNWKQTHYHCVYEDCPKVYVSTSDVQMHANFHRKNSEIVQEGFRRFRAHENCKIEECPFYGKKMSHYHCCREGCNHTFKNKADMDKHKSYHLKDFQLTQDGFKKILKTEICPFEDCKFSTVCNHIHCVRGDCNYILHSSSQMISHKRKHDRADGEQAYQTFKKQQKESSEDESPTTTTQQQQQQQQQLYQQNLMASCAGNNISTPLSSHTSAEQFLSRKRGRPPKMIQLPADSSNADMKRFKLETESQQQQILNLASSLPTTSSMFPPYLPNFNSAAAAAAMQQSLQSQDPNAPNFQLTHLMALFQLQNPLFYQNLYPGGMAGMLAAGAVPQNAAMLGNLAAFNSAAAAAASAAPQIKSEFSDNKQYKE